MPSMPQIVSVFTAVVLGAVFGSASGLARVVAHDSHDGYFVSNRFRPDEAATYLVLRDRGAFDEVFGVAMVMGDRSRRLPGDAFDQHIVVAAIKRGPALVEYKVIEVVEADGVLSVRYTTRSTVQAGAEFACPLIVSVRRGDYASVEFVEDGKVAARLGLAPPTTQGSATTRPAVDARLTRGEGTIALSVDKDGDVLTMTCARGIGGAVVERRGEAWPDGLVLRLHLRGLESLKLSCGRVTLAASVASHGEHGISVHHADGGREGPALTPESEYWLDIRRYNADGRPADGLPGQGGWFEVRLPRALLSGGERVTVDWIDFYR